ncbi:hypothetical protein GUITHDRAFT_134930 [Guillardia theta CCMP2712]|uniref:Uncharacterized protein n=1 Tax=Guillardia theta (strain CCMP2712) TaxID=905079 RepID=L1JRN0_GUITC|nr:hypothetical protein GUITHDRAFT_134930 [Guillardia theta CCMP2712]EKX50820.1 hypothetical protein GUITHDRAFT_134930 [Guillardia theta CCMP2712]|eukprot:XP_005837800.1 hypothetical protein GUITHDRAFT_134930 [Guillardia theta CCMP2712]
MAATMEMHVEHAHESFRRRSLLFCETRFKEQDATMQPVHDYLRDSLQHRSFNTGSWKRLDRKLSLPEMHMKSPFAPRMRSESTLLNDRSSYTSIVRRNSSIFTTSQINGDKLLQTI